MSTSISATEIGLPDNAKLKLGTGEDLQIFHNGSASYIQDVGTGNLVLAASDAIIFQNSATNETLARFYENGAVELYHNNSKKFETTSGGCLLNGDLTITDDLTVQDNLLMGDTDKIAMGDSSDLEIFHDGTDSFIKNDTGQLILRVASVESAVVCKPNAAVELYHNNSKKFETHSGGVNVTGSVNPTGNVALLDNSRLKLGTGDDLQLFHDGSNTYIQNATGSFVINADAYRINNQANNENIIKADADGAVELYYDNVKKMETSSVGVTMNDTLITNGEIRPANDNNHSIGRSNRRYITYFGVNGSINTSDKNEKNTIIDSDLGLDFINKLKPISYKWNKDDGKTHYGLIAQDLEETLTSLGKTIADFGGIYKEDDSPMGLGYSELIAPLIKAVQELTAKVEALEAK